MLGLGFFFDRSVFHSQVLGVGGGFLLGRLIILDVDDRAGKRRHFRRFAEDFYAKGLVRRIHGLATWGRCVRELAFADPKPRGSQ